MQTQQSIDHPENPSWRKDPRFSATNPSRMALTLITLLIIISFKLQAFKLAGFLTDIPLDLKMTNQLNENGERGKVGVKIPKDLALTQGSPRDNNNGPSLRPRLRPTIKDFNFSSWPGKKSCNNDEASKQDLEINNPDFTVFLAVHYKTSSSITRWNKKFSIILFHQIIIIALHFYHHQPPP